MINISLHIRKLPPAIGEGGILKSNTQSAKICLDYQFAGVGLYSEVKYSKCQDLPKFHFSGGGGEGGVFWNQIPEEGVLENLVKNLLCVQKPACASQIVSHILHMWRLTKTKKEENCQ